jgi:hypothetical protein
LCSSFHLAIILESAATVVSRNLSFGQEIVRGSRGKQYAAGFLRELSLKSRDGVAEVEKIHGRLREKPLFETRFRPLRGEK